MVKAGFSGGKETETFENLLWKGVKDEYARIAAIKNGLVSRKGSGRYTGTTHPATKPSRCSSSANRFYRRLPCHRRSSTRRTAHTSLTIDATCLPDRTGASLRQRIGGPKSPRAT